MSGPTLTFGTVSPFTGYPRSTSGNLVVNCMNGGTASATVTICVSFGVGTGGTTTSNRTLASGSNKLGIRVTNGSTDIGDGSSYPMYGPFSGNAAANASVGGNLPLTVTIPSPATPPAPGSYATTFNGTSAVLYYNTGSFSTCPALIASGPASSQFSVPVSATVPTQCTVSATGLAFPTSSLLTSPVNTTATVTTTCNASVPVTVALDNGATGTGPTARQMKSGSNVITYGIYQDAAASIPWGSTSGSNTQSAANGSATLTAYGRIPMQTSPAPGSYSDVVNVSITY